jgi:hypothetical protein
MNVYTLEFWLQVQQAYCKAAASLMSSEYLCHCSDAFEAAWQCNAQDIRHLATLFVQQNDHWIDFVICPCSASVLFHPIYDGALNPMKRRALRAQFIAWNIERIKAAQVECNGAS